LAISLRFCWTLQERDDLEKSLNSSQDHRQQLLSAISDLRPEK